MVSKRSRRGECVGAGQSSRFLSRLSQSARTPITSFGEVTTCSPQSPLCSAKTKAVFGIRGGEAMVQCRPQIVEFRRQAMQPGSLLRAIQMRSRLLDKSEKV